MTLRLVCAAALLALVGILSVPGTAGACGSESDCVISSGDYHISMPPPSQDGAASGAIVFLHGYQGTPEATMDFAALRETANRLGVALIVPRGLEASWTLPDAFPAGRDDVAFINAVVEDATGRFGIDRERVMISGFSVGASMVWYVACAEGQRYAGYAPIAGAFWEPYVEDCAMPLANIYHVHGTADDMVPLAGRRLSFAAQGDTYRSFALLREFGACEGDLAPRPPEAGLVCSAQTCGGGEQELCLHDGGHSIRPEWIARAWEKLAEAEGWN